MKCSRRFAENFRLASAVLGVISGIIALICFGLKFHNWACATWGITSSILAALLLAVEITNKLARWKRYKRCLIVFGLAGVVGMVLGLAGFVVYITYAAIEKHPIMPYGRSFWVVSVWCFMTFKHSFVLFYSSIHYFYRKSIELDPESEAVIVT